MSDLEKISKRIDAEISGLVVHEPLYGSVFLSLRKIPTTSKTKTIAVGPYNRVDIALFWNPKFIAELEQFELRAVLIHEALHLLLHHVTRPKSYAYEDFRAWNVSADISINPYINGLPRKAYYPAMFELPPKKSADFYYQHLKGKIPEDPDGAVVDDHNLWDNFDSAILKEKVSSIVSKSVQAQNSKGWGNIPGEVETLIRAAQGSLVDWKKVFQYFFHQAILIGRTRTRSRPNRRHGYMSPGHKRDYASKILVAFDTSASISDGDIGEFIAETDKMQDYADIDVVQFDEAITSGPVPWKSVEVEIKGRGGTNFFPIMELLKDRVYDGAVICTDGQSDFPPQPMIPLMWVVPFKHAGKEFPYGKKVVITEN